MPLYEYKCKQCGRHTEKRQKFSDPEITDCPYCNGPLERVISAPAISFKGSGWYKDLYSSPKPATNTNSTSSDAGKPSASTDASSGSASNGSGSSSSGDSSSPGASTTSATPAPASAPAKSST